MLCCWLFSAASPISSRFSREGLSPLAQPIIQITMTECSTVLACGRSPFVVAFAVLGSGAAKAVGTALQQSPPVAASGASPGGVDASTLGGAAASEPTPAQQRAAEADAKAETQAEAQAIVKSEAETAFYGFAAMLVGLVSALFGGVLGARHPEHFSVRPRRIIVVG